MIKKYPLWIAAIITLLFIIAVVIIFYKPADERQYNGSTVAFTNNTGKSIIVQVEVADTEEEREYGLMNRTSLAPDRGMLFVFDRDGARSFWMKNTLIPLDMIFVNEGGTIVDINKKATPLSESVFTAKGPCKYVVEVNGGFCDLHDIGIGDHATIRIAKNS